MSGGVVSWGQLIPQWQNEVKRVNPDLIQQLWAALEADSFSQLALARLDTSHLVERLLWPTLSDSSSNQQILLLALLIHFKHQNHFLSWSLFTSDPSKLAVLFSRLLSLSLDPSATVVTRSAILNCISTAFRSLEQDALRKECAPLVSIGIWSNLHSQEYLHTCLKEDPARAKAWRASTKRFDSSDGVVKTRLKIERLWLFSLVIDFLARLNGESQSRAENLYCTQFLEFLTDLISQLPTRRYTLTLLDDLNLVSLIKASLAYKKKENVLLRDLLGLFEHFSTFQTEQVPTTRKTMNRKALLQLQSTALRHFEEKLKLLALSTLSSISTREGLTSHLKDLSAEELERLCGHLHIRLSYPVSTGVKIGKDLMLQILLDRYSVPDQDDQVEVALPTEKLLYSDSLLRSEAYDGQQPLAIPKLNLQYLSTDDFLWRSFKLQQAEAFYEIRKDMESVVRKMKPQHSRSAAKLEFAGFAKMALPIDKPAIVDAAPPAVGHTIPSHVRAEVVLDVRRIGEKTLAEWDALKPKDTVFLLSVKPVDKEKEPTLRKVAPLDTANDHGIHVLRTAEVVQIQDEKGRPVREQVSVNGHRSNGTRRLLLDLDPQAFEADKAAQAAGKPDVYSSINVLARRAGRENNFKPLLESVQSLRLSQSAMSEWLQDVYLGYGQANSASWPQLEDRIAKIDFLDTFIDSHHLLESFAGKPIEGLDSEVGQPPFVLDLPTPAVPSSRKRKADQMDQEDIQQSAIRVSSYPPANTGPYPVDVPKKNTVRFTPKQVQAIVSSTQPGLSLVVGPPGTGKTDTIAQAINLLYHNFPEERILVIAHSNQALNQLFAKVVALDIDPKHLLRLGRGEEELETEGSFSRAGRVDSFMQDRDALLHEVSRLAKSLEIPGAHGASCETAEYFDQVHIQPRWSRFNATITLPNTTAAEISASFPFHKFFSNAPVPDLFPTSASPEEARTIAQGCHNHIAKVFASLSVIRPFELLRHPRDQQTHLLSTTARIIAMTATHASINRSDIISSGFAYHTLIMEEAAQITELESYIPMTLQSNPQNLKRIVLTGDHLQNSPVIQSHALRSYANLEQSLFFRLIRLGVPHVTLDAQGRCRPSITALFSWRYPLLTNLPHTSSDPEFLLANPGLCHPIQFIDVPPYGNPPIGELEPTPHFIQNLGEAEYAVALYQYMRLLNYPANRITILATYAGQRALIRDVLAHRCAGTPTNNRLFGMPRTVQTVDKYQGEQNDYIILSLVRTKSVGFLRDVRRLTVALSRARLGLYVVGSKDLWSQCAEFEPAMRVFEQIGDSEGAREGNLEVVTGEMFGETTRKVDDPVKGTSIMGVEHLGQYVFEMTQAKVRSLGGQLTIMDMARGDFVGDGSRGEDDAEEVEEGVDADADPLHEQA